MAAPRSDFTLIRRLLREPRGFLPHLAGVLALELLATPLALLAPVPLKLAVDSIVHHRPLPWFVAGWLPSADHPGPLLAWVCVLSLVIALGGQLQDLASSLLTTYTS